MALGKSFSTLTVVAPGVVLGGGPADDLVLGVVVTVVLLKVVVVLELVAAVEVVTPDTVHAVAEEVEVLTNAFDAAEQSSGDVDTTLAAKDPIDLSISGGVAGVLGALEGEPQVSFKVSVVDCTSLDLLDSGFSFNCISLVSMGCISPPPPPSPR